MVSKPKRMKRASEIEGITEFGQRWAGRDERLKQQKRFPDEVVTLEVDACRYPEGLHITGGVLQCSCHHPMDGVWVVDEQDVKGDALIKQMCPHMRARYRLTHAYRRGRFVLCDTCCPMEPGKRQRWSGKHVKLEVHG